MSQQMDDLTAEVANNTTVVGSVKTLIDNLVAQLTAAGTDPVALQAIIDTLKTNDAALAAAVTANTPTPPASGQSSAAAASAARNPR